MSIATEIAMSIDALCRLSLTAAYCSIVFRMLKCNCKDRTEYNKGERNMKSQWIVALACLVVGCGAMIANAEDAPKGNKGYTSSKATVVELGPEFTAMAGRQLRLRVLTIQPGGYIGLHSHKDRPSVVYFMQGTDTVTRDDGSSHTFHAGDMTGEPGTTVHWHRNDGKDAIIIVTADVFNAAKQTAKKK